MRRSSAPSRGAPRTKRADYRVQYPSGTRMRLRGKLAVVEFGSEGACPTIDTGHDVVVLDPRAIVRDAVSGRVVYHPDHVRSRLAPWVREWLDEHLAWGVAA